MQSLEFDEGSNNQRTQAYRKDNPYYKPIFHLCYQKVLKALGWGLILSFTFIVGLMYYSYIFDIVMLYHKAFDNLIITIIIAIPVSFAVINILFNYFMAVFTSPGTTEQFRNYTEEDFNNLNELFQGRERNICKKCNLFKPERTHHCSICDVCIFKMDHHCPWINNCVGHFNLRYFLLFNIWVEIAVIIMGIFYLPLFFSQSFTEALRFKTPIYPLATTLTYTLLCLMFFFNLWNWYLAVSGQTAIEFWGKRIGPKGRSSSEKYDFSYESKFDNLEVVFGKKSLIRMLLPSWSKLRFNGYYWNLPPSIIYHYTPTNYGDETFSVITQN